jgi:hypothetical protein
MRAMRRSTRSEIVDGSVRAVRGALCRRRAPHGMRELVALRLEGPRARPGPVRAACFGPSSSASTCFGRCAVMRCCRAARRGLRQASAHVKSRRGRTVARDARASARQHGRQDHGQVLEALQRLRARGLQAIARGGSFASTHGSAASNASLTRSARLHRVAQHAAELARS